MNHLVIGDIHGCGSEFHSLLSVVEAEYTPAATRIVLIGDLLTKGPAPQQVRERSAHTARAHAHLPHPLRASWPSPAYCAEKVLLAIADVRELFDNVDDLRLYVGGTS